MKKEVNGYIIETDATNISITFPATKLVYTKTESVRNLIDWLASGLTVIESERSSSKVACLSGVGDANAVIGGPGVFKPIGKI
jgi:hypothetical protein